MAGDPSDVRHTPINIFRMNILDVFGCSGNIGKIAASAVLCAFGFPVVPLVYIRKRGASAGIGTGSIRAP